MISKVVLLASQVKFIAPLLTSEALSMITLKGVLFSESPAARLSRVARLLLALLRAVLNWLESPSRVGKAADWLSDWLLASGMLGVRRMGGSSGCACGEVLGRCCLRWDVWWRGEGA